MKDLSFSYSSAEWRALADRAKARDGHRCTVSFLLGGACRGLLHAHHIEPVADGGDPFDLENVGTTCAGHHPQWEALRRAIVRQRWRYRAAGRCPHHHRSLDARLICESRRARQQIAA